MPRRRALTAATAVTTLLLTALGTAAARADTPTTLYVDRTSTACSDTGPGSDAAPFCTAQAAADTVEPGQTVMLRNATASGPVVISRSGTAAAPITFSGVLTNQSVPGIDGALLTIRNAQYVNLDSLRTHATGGAASVALVNAQHINLSRSTLMSAGSGTRDGLDIDGSSSDVNVTASSFLAYLGTAVKVAAGASHVTVASSWLTVAQANDIGLDAEGTTDLRVAGVSVEVQNGTGLSITGSSSGSVENTAISPLSHTQIVVSADSAAFVTADYNAVTADPSTDTYRSAYNWGGQRFTSSAEFYAATGQGRHDLDTLALDAPFPAVADGSPLIDSGDADAPGESATDVGGRARVDDPLVPNTGTGAGTTDRGDSEFQDPLTVSAVTMAPTQGPAPLPVTVTAAVQNTWSTPVTGYTFDFGDGTPTQDSTVPSISHTFQNPALAAGGTYTVTVTVHGADGVSGKGTGTIKVGSPGPLVPHLGFSTSSTSPSSVGATLSAISPWAVTGHTVDFGDGSPVVHADGPKPQLQHTFPGPGTYTVTDTATDAGGRSATATQQVTLGTSFTPLVYPPRVLDTRIGTGGRKAKIGPGGIVKIKVAGAQGIPAKGVAAVTMNVTDVNASTDGVITAYPDGSARPGTSNLNFRAGQVNPNLVTVPVSNDGYVDLYNASGSVDLVADIQGYFRTSPVNAWDPSATYYLPTTPTRVVDTRIGTGGQKAPLQPGQCLTHSFPAVLPGNGAVAAAVLNVTATGASSGGWIGVYRGGSVQSIASNLNFQAGQTTSNLVVVPVSDGAQFCNHAGSVSLIVDVQGYYFSYGGQPATGYLPLAPSRLVDTRNGTGAPKRRLGPNSTLRIKVTGTHGVPVGATAVTLNLTGIGSDKGTYLTAYSGGTRPTASNINLAPGQTRPILATVPVDSSGYITVYNYNGTVDVVADLEGYYAPVAPLP
ncbi:MULTISPECIES: PKD domain-containing protein [Streptacidiphilus]|uniref:PKD domain-containing protein n=1 Tax=Streptacidiphilus cavernicola TaxID=3342716 RepID=A0ABV6UGR3_9ACTN|nr:PKD domain-containing protein [Streptacidiphilus jeojiense]